MCTRCAFVGSLAAFAAAPAVALARNGDPVGLEIAMPGMSRMSDTLWLGQVSPNVWIHTTTAVLEGYGYYPANGAIVVDGNEATLIDTAWTPACTRAILAAWKHLKLAPITKALATHFHYDRTGGIEELTRRNIPTYGNPLPIGLAIDAKLPPPLPLHDVEKAPRKLGSIEVFYPGAGHTIDNIVVWIPSDRVLFGGCLVKSTTAPDLGNLSDGVLPAWPATIRRVSARYSPRHSIPGHGTIAGNSLAHTTALADAANAPAPKAGPAGSSQ